MAGLRESIGYDVPDKLGTLLSEIASIGVVLDFSFYGCTEPEQKDSHQYLARKFLHARFVESTRYREHLIKTNSRHLGAKPWWDRELLLGSRLDHFAFWDRAEEDLVSDEFSVHNLHSAFFNPPYKLQASIEHQTALFESLKHELFSDCDPEDFLIWSWSNQCSSYFLPGLEWWGAYLWTISTPRNSFVTLIGASTSD